MLLYIVFLLAAVAVVAAAIYLNQFGDVISKKSSLSGAAVGTFLIAGATSLPELTTSFTAVYIGNPDIAVGNMLGSVVFNLLILAVVDFVYRKKRLFQNVSQKGHTSSALQGLLFLCIIIAAILISSSVSLFNIGLEMFIIVFLYIIMMRYVSSEEEEEDEELATKEYSLKVAIIGFIIAALGVFVAGSILSIYGDKLAQVTGMNSSFIGSFLIAASTSLPELVTVLAAFKLANYNMAIGSILGSNLFNIQLLAFTDLLYRDAAILTKVNSSNIFIAILGATMTVVVLYLLKRPTHVVSQWRYAAPSILMAVLYFVVSYVLY